MKAFRPSLFGEPDDFEDEDARRTKDANLERYAKRAEKGQLIFPDDERRMCDELEMA